MSRVSMMRCALWSAPALLLAACGGGGGGDAPAAPAPAAVSQVAITSANAKVVAADALDTATNIDAAASGSALVTGVQVDAGGQGAAPSRLAGVARYVLSMAPASPALVTGVAVNETVNCQLGGTLTMTGNVSGGSSLVAGDTLTITANNCKGNIDGVTTLLSGSMTITVVSGSFNSNATTYPSRIKMTMVAQNFSTTAANETSVSNGDLTIDLNLPNSSQQEVTLTGQALSSTITTPSGTRGSKLKNYTQTVAVSLSLTLTSVAASVETTNNRLGGAVAYDVSTPVGLGGTTAGDINSGQLRVAGAKSVLLLTAVGANNFTVQVDANADGVYESSTTTTLTELKSLR